MRSLIEIGLLMAFFISIAFALLSLLYDLVVRDCLSSPELNSRSRDIDR